MSFDAVSGVIVHETLDAIERELFQNGSAAAKERLGRDPLIVELDRTPPQRRADAMVEMATRARSAPDDPPTGRSRADSRDDSSISHAPKRQAVIAIAVRGSVRRCPSQARRRVVFGAAQR